MAENDPTIKLTTDGGIDMNENCDKPDLRRSLRKQQVMNPKGVDSPYSCSETQTSSKTRHYVGKDPEKLITSESRHNIDRSPEELNSDNKDPEKLNSGESRHNVGMNPMQLNSGKIVLSIDEINLKKTDFWLN